MVVVRRWPKIGRRGSGGVENLTGMKGEGKGRGESIWGRFRGMMKADGPSGFFGLMVN